MGIFLTKEAKDLCTENYKTLIREDDSEKWKDTPCYWIRRINIAKMVILSKTTYRFNIISIRIPMTVFQRITWHRPEIDMEYKRQNSQSNPASRGRGGGWNKAGGITLPDFRQHYKGTVIKAVWYWHKNKGNWKWIESPEINSHPFGQLIFNNGGKNMQWGKDSLLPTAAQGIGKVGLSHWNQ